MSILKVNKIQDTTGDDALTFDSSGNTTVNQTLTTTSANITTGGTNNLTISDGDLVIGTSGHGISFAATGGPTNGTGTQELLDDYEEGTWTPTFNGTVSNPTITAYGNQSGWYEKIGRFVHCTWSISVSDANWASDGTGYLCIGGFPFTPEWMIMYPLRNTAGWAAGSGYIPYGGYTDGGSTSSGALIRQGVAGESALNFAQRSGNMYIYTTCTYKTAL